MDSPVSQNIQHWSARQVIYATLFVAAILFLFSLLYRFSNILLIFLISIVLSIGIRPAVTKLNQHGIPRPGGVILLYLIGLALAALLAVFAVPLIVEQIAEISREIPTYYGNLRSALFQSSNRFLVLLATSLPPEAWMLMPNITGGTGETINQVERSVYYLGLFTRSVFTVTAILILGFYWTLESERSIRTLLLWVPMNRREQIREFIAEVEDKVGRFILGQSILCLSIGAMALVAYQLIGLPYALVLAIIAAILEAVPIIGPALGAVPALLVALSLDPAKAVWVVIVSVLIQGLENYLLVPRVMKRSVGVNPLLVLLTIAAFTSLFGLVGALLSIPVAVVVQLSIDRFIIKPADADIHISGGRGQVNLLRYEAQSLAQDIRKQLRQGEQAEESTDGLVDSLEAIARDLDQLLAETEQRVSES